MPTLMRRCLDCPELVGGKSPDSLVLPVPAPALRPPGRGPHRPARGRGERRAPQQAPGLRERVWMRSRLEFRIRHSFRPRHVPMSSPIAAQRSETVDPTLVRALARMGFAGNASFSPEGDRLAMVARMGGPSPQVWITDVEGRWPQQVTTLEETIGAGVSWSPRGDLIAVAAAPGGGMNVQVFVVRPDGTGLRRLTDGGPETNRLGPWTPDGNFLAVASNRGMGTSMGFYLVDVESAEMRLLDDGAGVGGIAAFSPDGKSAVASRTVQRGDNNLWLIDVSSGERTLLTPHEGTASFGTGGAKFDRGRDAVYFTSNADREMTALACVRMGAQTPAALEVIAEREDADLSLFDVTPDGHAILVWNVAGRSELETLNLRTGARAAGPSLPVDVVFDLDVPERGQRVALSCSRANGPSDIWLVDLVSREAKQLTRASHPGVDLESLAAPTLHQFSAHDGLPLTGWLYRPRDAGPGGSLVLSFHGGPEGQERPLLNATYQALVASRISVFAPNVRGSTGFGRTFVDLDNGALRFDAVRDIKSCIDFVTSAGFATAGHIGIMGGSYGGFMTTAGLTEFPELLSAGATMCGLVNFETFFAHTEPWMAAISKVEYGDPATELALLRALSPIHKIDRVVAPTLVLHGGNDTNVPVVEAEQVVESLRRRDIPVDYILYPDEGHGFMRTANREHSTLAITEWFARWL